MYLAFISSLSQPLGGLNSADGVMKVKVSEEVACIDDVTRTEMLQGACPMVVSLDSKTRL